MLNDRDAKASGGIEQASGDRPVITIAPSDPPPPPDAADEQVGTIWYRRTSTILLAGWCLGWAGWIGSGLAGLAGCPRGQHGCYQGPMLTDAGRWWIVAALGAVPLAGLCLFERRHPPTRVPRSAPRRIGRRWLLLGSVAGTLVGAHLVLLGPWVEHPFCAVRVRVNSVMAYPVNCDSNEFLRLAHDPGRVLNYHSSRQARPGYVLLSAAATATVGPVTHALRLDRVYRQADRAYLPLVAINLAVTVTAVALLAWLLAGLGTPRAATVALCGLVAVNEVTKAFTWTPHQQTFAFLVPVLTVVAGRWLLLHRPAWPRLAAFGVMLGAASLVYGSFLITVAAVVPILLARGRLGLLPAGAFLAAFAAPQLAWIAVCRLVTGDYYNLETAQYDEFIWLAKAVKPGGNDLWAQSRDMTVTTLRAVFVAGTVSLLIIVALAALAVLLRVRLGTLTAEQRATLVAAGLTIAAAVAFTWGIGIIADRLMFHAMPALLIVAGWLAARVAAASPVASRLASVLVAGAVTLSMWDVVTSYGPYS
ncbi:hypothetical protein AB0K00_47555 [Dactylosporangium sp. NPDC049525]|uniref:hypothetical protein n=1 Tax=Dactylosporangium sp. NPDC049525 TaxID=3154730 RepID=UPI00342516D7